MKSNFMILLLLLSFVISSRHPTYCSRLVALKKYIVFSWLLFIYKITLWPQLLGVQLNPRKDILPSGKLGVITLLLKKLSGALNPKHHSDTWTFWSSWRKLLRWTFLRVLVFRCTRAHNECPAIHTQSTVQPVPTRHRWHECVSKCGQVSQQTRRLDPMLFQCWSSQCGPILKQHLGQILAFARLHTGVCLHPPVPHHNILASRSGYF